MGPLRHTVTHSTLSWPALHMVSRSGTHTRPPVGGHNHWMCWGRGKDRGNLQFTCSYITHINTEKLHNRLGVHTLRNSKNPLEGFFQQIVT